MSKYKRLTNNNRNEYDLEYDFCCDCKYFGEPCGCNRPNGTCGNYDRFLETYNRLAELEDKIENGMVAQKIAVEKFAEKLKNVIHERDYVQGYAEIGLIEEINELLKEYEK